MTTMKSNSTNRLIPDSFKKLPNFQYEHFLGGISGGVTSTLALHPLDLIKIRFAVNDGKSTHTPQYKSVTNAFKLIIKEEGFRGLYKGVTANVWGSGSSWGLYFLYYNTLKVQLQGGDSKQALGYLLHMFAAAQAGIFTLIITNPIWVVKTRLCLQICRDNNSQCSQRYNGMFDGLIKIYKTEGMRGLYKLPAVPPAGVQHMLDCLMKSLLSLNLLKEVLLRNLRCVNLILPKLLVGYLTSTSDTYQTGFVPGLFGVSHGSIQFMVYEEMKNGYNKRLNRPINEKLSSACYISFAAISKLIAAVITYPYQVVRARLQDQNHSYKGTLDCVQKIFRYEGLPGFYKGMLPYVMHVLPNISLIFIVYEQFT